MPLDDPEVDNFIVGSLVYPNTPNEDRWHHRPAVVAALNKPDGEVGVKFTAKNLTKSVVWFRPFELTHRKARQKVLRPEI